MALPLFLFLILLFSTIILFFIWHFYYKRRGLPPGPVPLPLLGNVLDIARSGPGKADIYMQWRYRYGPIYTYWLGEQPVVCVAEYSKMVDTFVREGETFAGRPDGFDFLVNFTKGNENMPRGILSSNGEEWREQRRFVMQVLRDLGLGKSRIEEHILDEMSSLFRKIDEKLAEGEEETNFMPFVELAVGSTLNAMLFGHRLDGPDEAEFNFIKKEVLEFTKQLETPLAFLLAWNPKIFVHIPPFKDIALKLDAKMGKIENYFKQKIAKHGEELKEIMEESESPQDYVDAFLREMERRQNSENDGQHWFNNEEMVRVCEELWLAGHLTTSMMFAWGLAHLLHHPEYLAQIWEELDEQIGGPRMVTMADRPKLPFTNAVVNESLRVGSFVITNVPHALTKDTELDGFRLAKGTWIIPQFASLMSDENIFTNQEQFNPSHFLDEKGKLRKREEFIPFSLGKRQCPGESLARMQLFLLIANIFNQYKIMPGNQLPSLKCASGTSIVNECQPFKCRMEKRLNEFE